MSEFKGTPGPWSFSVCNIGHPSNALNHVVNGGPSYVARLFSVASTLPGMTSRSPSPEMAEANAHLIAAAPELLNACEKLVDYRRRAGPLGFQLEKCDDFICMMKVAISKALGKTK